MDVVVERCAGIDVHKDMVAVCVRVPGPDGERVVELAEFSTFTEELLALRDWLVAHGVTRVGMKPLVFFGSRCFGCWRTRWSAGCSTHGTCATCRAARPIWPTRNGSVG